MSFQPGLRVGAYEIEAQLGRGAMGAVYRAFHPELGRTVAIKVLDAISPQIGAPGRFRREAMAIAQLRHPNILTVFDLGEHEGRPYMVLEYAPGGSLASQLVGEPLPADRSLGI